MEPTPPLKRGKRRFVKIRGQHRVGRLRPNDVARKTARKGRAHPGSYEVLRLLADHGPLTIQQVTDALRKHTGRKIWIYNRVRKILAEAEIDKRARPIGTVKRGPPPAKWEITPGGREAIKHWRG